MDTSDSNINRDRVAGKDSGSATSSEIDGLLPAA